MEDLLKIAETFNTPTQAYLVQWLKRDLRNPTAWANIATELNKFNRLAEAELFCIHALDLDPQSAHANFVMGCTYDLQNQDHLAETFFLRAMKLKPDLPELERGIANFYLSRGKFNHYATDFYAKLSQKHGQSRTKPLWEGQEGKVYITAEQGVGDQILFLTAELPPNRIIQIDDRLWKIAKDIFKCPIVQVSNNLGGLSLPPHEPFDYQISAGEIFLRHFDKPKTMWLQSLVEEAKEKKAMYKKAAGDKKVVGISWNSSNVFFGNQKSIRLFEFYPIIKDPEALHINLQYDGRFQEIADFNTATGLLFASDPDVDAVNDLKSGLLQIAACDHVVTVSNSVAHMAGAMGIPVSLLCPRAHGRLWYWFMNRSDSPIYPSMKIYRQSEDFTWTKAINEIAQQLGTK